MTGVGAVIAFAAAVANAWALVLQSQEARTTDVKQAARFSLLLGLARRPRWLIGTLLVMIAWPLQIVSLSFAPLTVVQPVLASFQLVLVLITYFWMRQPVGHREWLGAVAVTAGVVAVIVAAPHRDISYPSAWHIVLPLVAVGLAAACTFVIGRTRRSGLALALGAGFGYAWVDFTDKLVSNAFSTGRVVDGVIWLIAVACVGAVAFLLENSALQRRAAVSVAPVIGALQEPLPVIMALAATLEQWHGGAGRVIVLSSGLLVAGAGAFMIARSPVTTAVSTGAAG